MNDPAALDIVKLLAGLEYAKRAIDWESQRDKQHPLSTAGRAQRKCDEAAAAILAQGKEIVRLRRLLAERVEMRPKPQE